MEKKWYERVSWWGVSQMSKPPPLQWARALPPQPAKCERSALQTALEVRWWGQHTSLRSEVHKVRLSLNSCMMRVESL